ncbi:unnamed protein product, partial [Ectocarpus sp. 12 AP-2014]
ASPCYANQEGHRQEEEEVHGGGHSHGKKDKDAEDDRPATPRGRRHNLGTRLLYFHYQAADEEKGEDEEAIGFGRLSGDRGSGGRRGG